MSLEPSSAFRKFSRDIGLVSLLKSPLDVQLLIYMKIVRSFAFGQTSIFLVRFFKVHGFSESLIGIFMSSTLIGDALLSYFLTLNTDRIGRRVVLLFGALVMLLSGIIFAFSNNFYFLLVAAIVGVISPSGSDIGPFKAIEESTLAQLVSVDSRNDIYAWYSLSSNLANALGSFVGGWYIHFLKHHYDLSDLRAYKTIYIFFAFWGAVKLVLTMFLSSNTESDEYNRKRNHKNNNKNDPYLNTPSEVTALISDSGSESNTTVPTSSSATFTNNHDSSVEACHSHYTHPDPMIKHQFKLSLLSSLSYESAKIVVQLSIIFAIEGFAASLVPVTWISYYCAQKFNISTQLLGTMFFTTGIIGSFAMLFSSSIARHVGIILTMVLTHLPSSVLVLLLPFPSSFYVTFSMLVLRSCSNQMDTAPRQAFLSMIVHANERTAVIGWINVIRTISQIPGSTITGYFTSKNKQWICFVISGSLKILYDFLIFTTFGLKNINREFE